jgi:hypothetical protein
MRQMTNFLMLCFFGLPPILACAIAYGFVKTGAGTEIDERGLRDPEPARPAGLRLAVDNTPTWDVEAAE